MVMEQGDPDPGIEPLRQATSSPFDSLVGVMSGAGAGGMVHHQGVGMSPMAGAGTGYYGANGVQSYYGINKTTFLFVRLNLN